MGRYSAIPNRWKEDHEVAWDDAHADAMRALEDVNSDEMHLLFDSATDDRHDLMRIFADYFIDKDATMAGQMLGKLLERLADRIADDAAQKAADQVPREDDYSQFGVRRSDFV